MARQARSTICSSTTKPGNSVIWSPQTAGYWANRCCWIRWSFGEPDWANRRIEVRLTKQQLRQSPGVETDLPAARHEAQQATQVLLWEAYWSSILESLPKFEGDPHLRSTKMFTGLHLHCTNGELGHVADFLVDDQSWSVAIWWSTRETGGRASAC